MEFNISCVLLLAVFTKLLGVNAQCTPGMYFKQNGVCVPCSVCKVNQVALRLCHNDNDTVCGVIEGFQFVQFPNTKSEVKELTPITSGRQQPASPLVVADQQEDDKWFIITMVLVGIIVLTTVTGVVILLIMCYLCKQKQRVVICEHAYTRALLKDNSTYSSPKSEQFKVDIEK